MGAAGSARDIDIVVAWDVVVVVVVVGVVTVVEVVGAAVGAGVGAAVGAGWCIFDDVNELTSSGTLLSGHLQGAQSA